MLGVGRELKLEPAEWRAEKCKESETSFGVAKPEAEMSGAQLGGKRVGWGAGPSWERLNFAEEYLIISPFFFCPLPTC